MKKICLLLAALMICALAGCNNEEENKQIPILSQTDFRLHQEDSFVYLCPGGWLNPDGITNETLQNTTPHNILIKSTEEGQEDKKYKMEVREYTYTSFTLSNIDYERYNCDADGYYVNMIITTNPTYLTERNIKVGDTKTMVKEAYGTATSKDADEENGLVAWIYKLDDTELSFTFHGKYIVQITLSNLPEDIYEYTEGSSGEQVIMVDENGNIIGNNPGYDVIVESDGGAVVSQQTSSAEPDTASNTATSTSSDDGALIQVDGTGDYDVTVDDDGNYNVTAG